MSVQHLGLEHLECQGVQHGDMGYMAKNKRVLFRDRIKYHLRHISRNVKGFLEVSNDLKHQMVAIIGILIKGNNKSQRHMEEIWKF
jgi:hypothetical protein